MIGLINNGNGTQSVDWSAFTALELRVIDALTADENGSGKITAIKIVRDYFRTMNEDGTYLSELGLRDAKRAVEQHPTYLAMEEKRAAQRPVISEPPVPRFSLRHIQMINAARTGLIARFHATCEWGANDDCDTTRDIASVAKDAAKIARDIKKVDDLERSMFGCTPEDKEAIAFQALLLLGEYEAYKKVKEILLG